jgi:hypothetical protein
MELALAIVLAVGSVLAATVCVRRMTLGQRMDRALEALRSHPARSMSQPAVAKDSVPIPLMVWSKASFIREPVGDRAGYRVDTRAITAPVPRPQLPRAS